jgi:hypothetical protein
MYNCGKCNVTFKTITMIIKGPIFIDVKIEKYELIFNHFFYRDIQNLLKVKINLNLGSTLLHIMSDNHCYVIVNVFVKEVLSNTLGYTTLAPTLIS